MRLSAFWKFIPILFGERFYLKDASGNYLAKTPLLFKWLPRVGSPQERAAFTFTSGSGSVTHGSFALIQSQDPELGSTNILETSDLDGQCLYATNAHEPRQRWTIKSISCPYVGAEIQYGDQIYLENHLYLDIFQNVPGRLSQGDLDSLTLQPIIASDSASLYWIIEKA